MTTFALRRRSLCPSTVNNVDTGCWQVEGLKKLEAMAKRARVEVIAFACTLQKRKSCSDLGDRLR